MITEYSNFSLGNVKNQSSTTGVDTAAIAEMLGCSRAHVTNRITKRPDFPKPFINMSQKMRFWRKTDVLAYIQKKR